MNVSYGPPGLRGVTQLMAVGDADFETKPTDRLVQRGIALSLSALVASFIPGLGGMRKLSLGAAAALIAVQVMASKGSGNPIEISTQR